MVTEIYYHIDGNYIKNYLDFGIMICHHRWCDVDSKRRYSEKKAHNREITGWSLENGDCYINIKSISKW